VFVRGIDRKMFALAAAAQAHAAAQARQRKWGYLSMQHMCFSIGRGSGRHAQQLASSAYRTVLAEAGSTRMCLQPAAALPVALSWYHAHHMCILLLGMSKVPILSTSAAIVSL
jgi:hypothetical protein